MENGELTETTWEYNALSKPMVCLLYTSADLVRYTIPSIYEVFTHWGIPENYYHFNGQYNFFELYNKSRIYLIDAKYNPCLLYTSRCV